MNTTTKGTDITEQEHLIEHLRDEERAAAANAIQGRIDHIQHLPEAKARAAGKTPYEAAQAAQEHVNKLMAEMQRARARLEAEGARRQ